MSRTRRIAAAVAATALTLLAGCATRGLDSEWRDPQYTSRNPAKVMVVCASSDEAVKRLCEDKIAAALRARLTTAMLAREAPQPPSDAAPQAYLPGARAAGATTLLFTRVAPSGYTSGNRSSVGIGLGGFGGGNVGFGIGVGVPIGGRQPEIVLVANATLLELGEGRTVWAGTATARDASDVNNQLDSLSNAVVDGVHKAGVL